MDIETLLKYEDFEHEMLKEQTHFNCEITISRKDGKNSKYLFDDYRVAQGIQNLLDNMKFVKCVK